MKCFDFAQHKYFNFEKAPGEKMGLLNLGEIRYILIVEIMQI